MIKKNSSTKIILALISLIITFFVWQQGLRDSLNRPSVSFDISQKEQEITELALQSTPNNLKKFLINNDPIEEIHNSLSEVSFDQLTDRNKIILIISSDFSKYEIHKSFLNNTKSKKYSLLIDEIQKKYNDNLYKPSPSKFDLFKSDKYLYHLLSKKFDFDDSSLLTKSLSSKMFLKVLAIKLIPLFTVLLGSIIALKTLWNTFLFKKIDWKEFTPLDLNLIDMILLIAGGFVVLGEVITPLFSITLVELFSENLSSELSQSLKIFFGYLFMAFPPLLIIYLQIKSLNGEYTLKKDYFELSKMPIKYSFIKGFQGWLMIIPFVLLVSLIMNFLIDNKNGSNPLLEIVLNTNNYLALILLLFTTTILAPLFEEIIFRGILLPILSRDFGIISGISISAFIFALAHLSISEMPPLFVLGIGLGITRIVSGSLLSSVFMHSLWNGLTFLNLFLLRT